jgi:glycine cleavage system transcriptional repressor
MADGMGSEGRRFAVAVMGRDRPGIVADVTSALLDLDGNVEDVATSILRGHFAMMLVFEVARPTSVDAVRGGLRALPRPGDLTLSVWPAEGSAGNTEATHLLSVYGPDRMGIVHAVAQELAALGVNICDMVCRLHDENGPVYVLTVEVAIPGEVDPGLVEDRVAQAAELLGLTASLRSLEQADL